MDAPKTSGRAEHLCKTMKRPTRGRVPSSKNLYTLKLVLVPLNKNLRQPGPQVLTCGNLLYIHRLLSKLPCTKKKKISPKNLHYECTK